MAMIGYSTFASNAGVRAGMGDLFEAIKKGDAAEAEKALRYAMEQSPHARKSGLSILDVKLEGHDDFEGKHGTLRDMAKEYASRGPANEAVLRALEQAELNADAALAPSGKRSTAPSAPWK